MPIFKAWLFCLLITQPVNAQELPSTLYFIRTTGTKAAEYCFSTFVNDSLYCKLNDKKFSMHGILPGLKTIHAQYGGSKSRDKPQRISIQIEPGRIYYVKLHLEQGFGGCDLLCTQLTPADARELLKDLKADSKCE